MNWQELGMPHALFVDPAHNARKLMGCEDERVAWCNMCHWLSGARGSPFKKCCQMLAYFKLPWWNETQKTLKICV